MSDVDIIRKIEKEIGKPLKQESIEELLKRPYSLSPAYSVGEDDEVTVLRLNSVKIKDFSFLRELKGLTSLNLYNNNLSDVSFLRELKGLTSLNLGWNIKITDYSFLRELKGLTSLNLNDNKLSDVSFLRELKGLTSLNLGGNKQISDYSFLCEIKGLTSLYLYNNNLSDVSFLRELKGLTLLYLGGNEQITDYSFLHEIKRLTSLDLFDNNLSDVSFISELKSLTHIDLGNNPNLKEPPESVIEEGVDAIRRYFRLKEEQGTDFLYEAKVLFVGEPKAGKTSLMKKLVDPDYPVPNPDPEKKEKSTLGIDIIPGWTFPYEKDSSINFKAHLWDFGGQNIQYYIHQFFLTERSLYVLLVDDRKDLPNTDYWLDIIKLLGKGSPVLLVQNEKEIDASTGFDRVRYERSYKDHFDLRFADVNLSKNDGRLDAISRQIKSMLSNLKHVGDPLPAGWIKVRKKVTELREKNHLPLSEYKRICETEKITAEADQELLCGHLHNLGIILHYRGESGLADTVFLNPEWITDAVYAILSSKELERKNGLFTKKWLFEKWGNKYEFEEKNKLLILMQKEEFDLCYRLEAAEEESYLAPQLLQDVAPDRANQWEYRGDLSFRYKYDFMPSGIITRIIVRLSTWISADDHKRDLVWRSGVILEKDGCEALIKGDFKGGVLKSIDISVKGDDFHRKSFLSYIRGTIDEIHRVSFEGIEFESYIPCCCEVCVESDDPSLFELDRIEKFIKADEDKITCEKGTKFRKISIVDLLEGVSDHLPSMTFNKSTEEWKDDGESKFKDKILELLEETISRNVQTINIEGSVENVVTATDSSKTEFENKPAPEKKYSRLEKGAWLAAIVVAIAAVITLCIKWPSNEDEDKAELPKPEQTQQVIQSPVTDEKPVDTKTEDMFDATKELKSTEQGKVDSLPDK